MSPLEKLCRAYEDCMSAAPTVPLRDLDAPYVLGLAKVAMMAALKTMTEDQMKAVFAMVRE